MMKKDLQKSRLEDSQINLRIEETKLIGLIDKIRNMGGEDFNF